MEIQEEIKTTNPNKEERVNVTLQKTYTYEEAYKCSLEYFNGDELAAQVFLGKYALTTPEGEILEPTPDLMHRRLAKEFARIEAKYPNPLSEEEIYSYLKNFSKIVPQGSPMSGIGNPYQLVSLSNCFVIQSPYDSYGGILKTDQELAQLFKRRCGVGLDISTIRPKGISTSNAAKTTDGIAVFMERFSNTCREVATKGRRGAEMITISVHHPEIETFINIKRNLKKVTGANISIKITDEFMNAVKDDTDVELRWPVDSDEPKFSNFVKAKDIWKKIIEAAHSCAEPGLLFWDNIINESPADCYMGYETTSTNPCLTKDTWIMTSVGPRQIQDLIGKKFTAVVNGKDFECKTGFFKTKNSNIFEIKTKQGFKIKGTGNHQILTKKGWIKIENLKISDTVIIQNHPNMDWDGEGTFEEGWLVGEMVGDGCFNPEKYYGQVSFWGEEKEYLANLASQYVSNLDYNFRSDFKGGICPSPKENKISVISCALDKLAERYISKKEKELLPTLEKESSDFCKGFLRGFFDADGSVQGNLKKGISVRLGQSDLKRLEAVQRILLRFGIFSKIFDRRPERKTLLPDGKGGKKYYNCKKCYEIIISRDQIDIFAERIGFEDRLKLNKLKNLLCERKRNKPYKTKFEAQISEIRNLNENQDVYDCSIEEIHQFDANGITVHNCSELPLSNYDSCRLLLVNTLSFVENPFTDKAKFDFEGFAKIGFIAQRLLDDLIDLELECIDNIINKINLDPEPEEIKTVEKNLWLKVKKFCQNGRRTGLGVTAIGDTVAALNKKYSSDSSIEEIQKIYKCLAISSYRSSIELAKERGAFPAYNWETEKNHPFINRIINEDKDLKEDWKKYGRRNISNLTTAPCGSVSILTQTTSGIEPAFLLSYKRRRKINPNDKKSRVDFIDDLGDKWQEYKVFHHGFKKWMEVTKKTEENIKESPYWEATSNDIDWVSSVKLQAEAQKWVDHAISRTCNLPKDTLVETVEKIYMEAWRSGCKGFTVYRDGCRSGVLINDEDKTENKPNVNFTENHAPKRPEKLPCDIYHMVVKGEKWNFFVGVFEERPYEIFAGRSKFIHLPKSRKTGFIKKNGTYNLYTGEGENELVIEDLASVFENSTESAFTRTCSLALRHGTPVIYLVEQLTKGADKDNDMFSLAKGLSRVLKNYIKDGSKASVKSCPECNSKELIYQEGCLTCPNCGWSKCS